MTKGTVKFYNDMKNFGFITGDDGKDYFFHISGVEGEKTLKEKDNVTFESEMGDRGEKAVKVKLSEKEEESEKVEIKEEKSEKVEIKEEKSEKVEAKEEKSEKVEAKEEKESK
jgi:cold shock protein